MQEKIERLSIEEIMKHCNRTCVRMELFAESQGITQDEIEDKAYWEHYQVKNYLEELRKYREIGTVGKVREYKEIVDNMDAVSMAALCISLNKLKEYQEIGTPDECLSNKNLTRIYAIYETHTKAGDNAMMSIAKRLLLSGYSQKWRYRV